jgi:hypothetical protein
MLSEIYASIATGAAITVAVIFYLPKRANAYHRSTAMSGISSEFKSGMFNEKDERYQESDDPVIDDGVRETLTQKPHLQKFFGVLFQPGAKEDLMGLDTQETDASMIEIVAHVIMGFLFVFLVILAINILTKGDFGRLLLGLFPIEIEALKLRDYFMKFHGR